VSAVNPWTPASTPVPEEPAPSAVPTDVNATLAGVARPQRGVTAPRVGLPAIPVRANDALWWVAAHGGAGGSTLAGLVPGTATAGQAWPDPVGGPAHCVLVCRTNFAGLRAAQTAMTQWAAGAAPAGVQLHGLVAVADAPGRRLPRPLRDFLAVLRGGVQQLWHLEWVEAWRIEPAPSLQGAPRPVARTIRDLTELTTSLATARGNTEERYLA